MLVSKQRNKLRIREVTHIYGSEGFETRSSAWETTAETWRASSPAPSLLFPKIGRENFIWKVRVLFPEERNVFVSEDVGKSLDQQAALLPSYTACHPITLHPMLLTQSHYILYFSPNHTPTQLSTSPSGFTRRRGFPCLFSLHSLKSLVQLKMRMCMYCLSLISLSSTAEVF